MKTVTTLMAMAVALTACGDARLPIVDMVGKDQAQANRDMAYCTVSSREQFSVGNGITKCMRAKGYTILVGN